MPISLRTFSSPNRHRNQTMNPSEASKTRMKIKKFVLHVDDDPAILGIVRKSLQIRGYEVVSINDSSKASEAIAKWSPRVIILDINMPGIDGMTLLKEIKQRDASVQVVVLTGMVSMATVLQATRLGAQECVFKPLKSLSDVGIAVDRCFANIESWWDALRDWTERKNAMAQTCQSNFVKNH